MFRRRDMNVVSTTRRALRIPQRSETLRESFQEKMRQKGAHRRPEGVFRVVATSHGPHPEAEGSTRREARSVPTVAPVTRTVHPVRWRFTATMRAWRRLRAGFSRRGNGDRNRCGSDASYIVSGTESSTRRRTRCKARTICGGRCRAGVLAFSPEERPAALAAVTLPPTTFGDRCTHTPPHFFCHSDPERSEGEGGHLRSAGTPDANERSALEHHP